MTQEEIIEMATQVYGECEWHESALFHLHSFAKLVAEKATEEANARANASWTLMCEKMVAFEREACAQVAFSWNHEITDLVAKEIRARGDA